MEEGKMDMSTGPTDPFIPPSIKLDGRFTKNLGGDGSNGVSRSIYPVIDPGNETDPKMTLEIYTKFNADIPDQRELHGNVILEINLKDGQIAQFGWLFSKDENGQVFDGMLVTSNAYSSSEDYKENYRVADLWMEKRPFTDGEVQPLDLPKDSANDWNITAMKSSLTCPEEGGRCKLHAHFNRKF